MAQITEKELSALSDMLNKETCLTAKYEQYASEAEDSNLKNQYEALAQRHRKHFDELYACLR